MLARALDTKQYYEEVISEQQQRVVSARQALVSLQRELEIPRLRQQLRAMEREIASRNVGN